jgi:hypothetical protein
LRGVRPGAGKSLRSQDARRLRLLLAPLLFSACLITPFDAAADAPAADHTSRLRADFGFEERVRSEIFDNTKDWDSGTGDRTEQLRFRTKLWGKLAAGDRAELMAVFNNESRKIYEPDTDFQFDEIVFDNLYLDWRFDDGLELRLGRQNLIRGAGFILTDGTPGDGSRTLYFNALDLIKSFADSSRIEILVISDPHRDHYLPVINDRDRTLIERDEAAAGLYLSSRDLAATTVEAYYFLKTERNDTRPADSPAFQPDRSVQTLGGRLDLELAAGFSVAGELAGQWGSQEPDDDPIRAGGGYARVKKTFVHAIRPSLAVAWIGLSGDDPATGAREGWDPLFSRWPSWSELYVYNLAQELGTAYWTNEKMLQAEFLATPWTPLDVRATYYRMGAFHPFPGDPAVFAGGRHRGDLAQFRADVRAGQHWKGHILYEWMAPGDFYAGGDAASFLRAEVIYTLKLAW